MSQELKHKSAFFDSFNFSVKVIPNWRRFSAFRVLPSGQLLEKPSDSGLGVGVRPALAIVVQSLSCVHLCAAPRTVAHQAPLSMGFPRQEYWSRLPFPTPGNLPNTEIEPTSLTSPALAALFFTTSAPWEAPSIHPETIINPFRFHSDATAPKKHFALPGQWMPLWECLKTCAFCTGSSELSAPDIGREKTVPHVLSPGPTDDQ